MKRDQDSSKAHRSKNIEKKNDINDQIANFGGQFEPSERDDDLNEHEKGKEEDRENESEEVAVVPLTDAGTDPGTVVIESLHADIAVIAVRGPRRPEDVTGIAKFDLQIVGLYGHCVDLLKVSHHAVLILAVQRHFLQVFVLVARENLGNHPRVGEAQHYQNHLHRDVQYD